MDSVHYTTSAMTFGNHAAPNDPSRMYDDIKPALRPSDGGYCSTYNTATAHAGMMQGPQDASTRTTRPIVTGTSVLGLVYNGGVIVAADTLGSYGSLARFRSFQRIKKVNDCCFIAASGDLSDYQHVSDLLDQMVLENRLEEDGQELQPREVFNYLSRVLYNRRNKMDPLWNYIAVAGFQNNEPFLALVDLMGTCYEDKLVATGYGAHIAMPLLRNAYRPDLTKEAAEKVMTDAMRVLVYRECRTVNNIQFATAEAGIYLTIAQCSL